MSPRIIGLSLTPRRLLEDFVNVPQISLIYFCLRTTGFFSVRFCFCPNRTVARRRGHETGGRYLNARARSRSRRISNRHQRPIRDEAKQRRRVRLSSITLRRDLL